MYIYIYTTSNIVTCLLHEKLLYDCVFFASSAERCELLYQCCMARNEGLVLLLGSVP